MGPCEVEVFLPSQAVFPTLKALTWFLIYMNQYCHEAEPCCSLTLPPWPETVNVVCEGSASVGPTVWL